MYLNNLQNAYSYAPSKLFISFCVYSRTTGLGHETCSKNIKMLFFKDIKILPQDSLNGSIISPKFFKFFFNKNGC